MKKKLKFFTIKKDQKIVIESHTTNYNYHYKPSSNLTKFDEVSVSIVLGEESITLGSEMIDIVLEDFQDACLRVLNIQADLPHHLDAGAVGQQYMDTLEEDGDFSDYLSICLWSGPLIPTFLYKCGEKLYLEVAEPHVGEGLNEKGRRSHVSRLIEIPQEEIIVKWLNDIKILLREIESNHIKRLNPDSTK